MNSKSDKDSPVQFEESVRILMHEMKNPLSAMSVQTALLRNEIPRKFHGDLDILDREIQRLNDLTNDIAEFTENPVGNVCETELISFVSETVRLFKSPVRMNTGSLSAVYIEFDRQRARSVLENLIKNAFESTQSGNPDVEISVYAEKDKIVLEVLDRGDGIPASIKGRIFDLFFTTKQGGSGIGLALCRRFVNAAGGSLELLDRAGGGTVARVTLPGKAEYKK